MIAAAEAAVVVGKTEGFAGAAEAGKTVEVVEAAGGQIEQSFAAAAVSVAGKIVEAAGAAEGRIEVVAGEEDEQAEDLSDRPGRHRERILAEQFAL